MALTVNTNIINDTDQYLLDAKNVRGTYVVVATIADRNNLPIATLLSGTLCYCQEDSTIYQCTKSDNNTVTWEEKIFGELNANAFSKIRVGDKTVSADCSEDTVTLTAGAAITLTGDQNSDTIEISAKLQSETALDLDSVAATTTSGKVYPVALDKSGYLAVNVPWTDTNTHNSHKINSGLKAGGSTYIEGTSSSTSLTLGDSGVASGQYGPTSNKTPSFGGNFYVPDITVNDKGIVTEIHDRLITLPSDPTASLSGCEGKVKIGTTWYECRTGTSGAAGKITFNI